MAEWYVEARGHESWHDASAFFLQWLATRVPNQAFGYGEGPTIVYGGRTFHHFCFFSEDEKTVECFREWADSTGRINWARGHEFAGREFVHAPPCGQAEVPPGAGVARPSDVCRDADATVPTPLLDAMFSKMALTSQRLLA